MKALVLFSALFGLTSHSMAFADTVLLQAGSSVTITPGTLPTVVSCAAGTSGPSVFQEFKCTLRWTSVFGDTRPAIVGVGASPDAARAQITTQCKTQSDPSIADKCVSEVAASDCQLVKF